MATYGGGQKASNAIGGNGNTNSTLYTAPSDSYAVVQLYVDGGGIVLSVGGQIVFAPSAAGSLVGVRIGPGHALTMTTGGNTAYFSGVELQNQFS